LKRLYEESKNPVTSVFTSSILFFLIHIPILFTMPHLNGNLLMLFMATDLILSISNSFLFLSRKNIILPILIHAFYNLAITFYL
jgi:membrane protease YdiL (CAAX protease family)